jgi:hypothetical protein
MPYDDDLFDLGDVKLEKGTQIVYVPSHIPLMNYKSKFGYPNGSQPGFITSGPTEDGSYFCRYWLWDHEANEFVPELRTKDNSELTPGNLIVVYEEFSQYHVKRELEYIERQAEFK